ncbi:MAG: hypothetical protein ABSH47_15630 [Bryobacteraceae bacterium]
MPATEAKGLPPRATPDEYQTKGQAGAVTLAADFVGHSVPTPTATYSTEDFVVVEAALFGSPGARATLSSGDFSLRINDKKAPLPSQPYEFVARTLKDPEWAPPAEDKSKSKTGINTGGKDSNSEPLAPVHMPIALQLAMEQRVKNAVLLGGDRALPQAGLIFFQYRGKPQSIHSVELIYTGPSGKATLTLQP